MAEKSETLVTKEDKLSEAKELFGRGSRNYCMKQYADAADDLSTCCAVYSELYGPTAEECGMPYLLYAKSLIALGKDENNLIVAGEDEEGDEDAEGEDGEAEADGEGEEEGADAEGDEEAEGANEEEADKEESSDQKKSDKNAETKDENSDKIEANNDVKKNDGDGSSSKAEAEPQPGPSTANGTESTEEGEDEKGGGNLEVAWEILELAVKIFENKEKSMDNLAECYSNLADISLENSHFSVAINDYRKALAIYEKYAKQEFRTIAEIYYKVGLCHLMINEFEDSIKSLHLACKELDKVLEVEEAKEQDDETKATIKDLQETKKEIIEKIAEVEETKKTSIEEVKRELSKIIVKGESSNGFDAAGPSSSATNGTSSSSKVSEKPTDISHLIKRKKPDTAPTEAEGSPAKKVAIESEKASE